MKKVLYAFILLLCLGGGLGVGWMRQRAKDPGGAGGGDDLVIDPKAIALASTPADGSATDGSTGTDLTAMTEGGATSEAAVDSAVPADASVSSDSMSAATPVEMATPDSGRTFAGGTSAAEPKATKTPRTSGSSGGSFVSDNSSSGNSGSSVSSTRSSARDLPAIPDNTVINIKDNTGSGFGTEVFDETPTKKGNGKKPKATPVPVASDDTVPFELDDLPTVDAGDPTPAPAVAATPDPFAATEVASIPAPSFGGGDMVFPKGSRNPALKKITQKQAGERTVVHIDLSGQPKYRLFRVKNPNRVMIDLEETEVPGGAPSPVGGSAPHVKEISAKPVTNAGGLPLARILILLSDEKLPTVNHEYANGGLDVTIGGNENF